MLVDLLFALAAAIFVGVAPGYFLSLCLVPAADRVERGVLSAALSVALSPAVALGLARVLGSGITLPIAVAAPMILAFAGFLALRVFGPVKVKGDAQVAASAPTLPPPVFIPLAGASLLALGSAFGEVPLSWTAPPTAVLIVIAGVLHLWFAHREDEPGEVLPDGEPSAAARLMERPLVRQVALAAVLGVMLVKGYVGPILHDWPFIRGVDHYSHAVMANLMMERGRIEPYLIYPPGFHTLTAMVSRLSGLDPLEIFPVLGPALLLLPALALYVLGQRLWGPWAGITATLLLAFVGGTYQYFEDAMYPNLVTSQFLMVMTIVALIGFYRTPTRRSGAFLVLVGASVTLFHPVASLYLALLLALIGAFLMPYLILRRRSTGVALTAAFAVLGVLAAVYAWDTYDITGVVAGLAGGGTEKSTTGDAVGMALGTQLPYRYDGLIGYTLSQPVTWLGLLGLYLLIGVRDRMDFSNSAISAKLSRLTVLLWVFMLLIGSCTPMSGFPQRFGRDLGIPLCLLAAFAILAILRSLGPLLFGRTAIAKPVTVFASALTALSLGTLMMLQMYATLKDATGPSEQITITPQIGEAGKWLEAHNTGGNIMISPHGNQVPGRMMLAMGDYSKYQSFERFQILHPRDLPPTSTAPLWDVYFVTHNPGAPHTKELLKERDVRYVVLYKYMPDRRIVDFWVAFKSRPNLYSVAFENDDVLIVKPRP